MAWQESSSEWSETVRHVPSALEKHIGVWALNAGRNRAKPAYKIGPRFYVYYSLHVVLHGELLLTFRGRQVVLKSGDFFCMQPDETYEYQIRPGSADLQLAWLAFQGPLASPQLRQTQLSAAQPFVRSGASRALIAMMHEIRELIGRQPDNSLLITGKLLEFLHLLAEAARSPEPAVSSELPLWLDRGKLYMDIHFSEGITVEQVANWLGLSRSHFSKAFHRHTGISPTRYLQSLRMEEAQKRLAGTSHSVTEIALSLGYGDLFAFTRAFTRHYGMSPRDYRAKTLTGRN